MTYTPTHKVLFFPLPSHFFSPPITCFQLHGKPMQQNQTVINFTLLFQILFQSCILLSIFWQLLFMEDIREIKLLKSSEGAYANYKLQNKKATPLECKRCSLKHALQPQKKGDLFLIFMEAPKLLTVAKSELSIIDACSLCLSWVSFVLNTRECIQAVHVMCC